jgi:hypothetical protein
MRKALFDPAERRRLYKEAREYLSLRYRRKKFVRTEKSVALAREQARP